MMPEGDAPHSREGLGSGLWPHQKGTVSCCPHLCQPDPVNTPPNLLWPSPKHQGPPALEVRWAAVLTSPGPEVNPEGHPGLSQTPKVPQSILGGSYCTRRYVMYLPAVSLGRMIFTTCPRFIPK